MNSVEITNSVDVKNTVSDWTVTSVKITNSVDVKNTVSDWTVN